MLKNFIYNSNPLAPLLMHYYQQNEGSWESGAAIVKY